MSSGRGRGGAGRGRGRGRGAPSSVKADPLGDSSTHVKNLLAASSGDLLAQKDVVLPPPLFPERQIDPIMDIQTSSFEVGNMAVNYIEDLKLHGFHIGLPLPPPEIHTWIASRDKGKVKASKSLAEEVDFSLFGLPDELQHKPKQRKTSSLRLISSAKKRARLAKEDVEDEEELEEGADQMDVDPIVDEEAENGEDGEEPGSGDEDSPQKAKKKEKKPMQRTPAPSDDEEGEDEEEESEQSGSLSESDNSFGKRSDDDEGPDDSGDGGGEDDL